MVNGFFDPVPLALPDGDTAWASETASMLLKFYPTSGLAPPVASAEVAGTADITHLRLLKVLK